MDHSRQQRQMTNEMMDSLEAKQVSEVFCVKVFAFVRCTIVFANYCGSVWSLGAARALKKEFFRYILMQKKSSNSRQFSIGFDVLKERTDKEESIRCSREEL